MRRCEEKHMAVQPPSMHFINLLLHVAFDQLHESHVLQHYVRRMEAMSVPLVTASNAPCHRFELAASPPAASPVLDAPCA
jgi:hypothetical protein